MAQIFSLLVINKSGGLIFNKACFSLQAAQLTQATGFELMLPTAFAGLHRSCKGRFK